MKQGLFYINKYNPKQRYNGLHLLSLNSRVVVFGTLLSIFVKSSTLKKKNQLSLVLKNSDKNLNERKQTWHMCLFLSRERVIYEVPIIFARLEYREK